MRFTSLFLAIIVLIILGHIATAQEHTYFTHEGVVHTVAYSPTDPSLFASAGESRAVQLWDLENDTLTTLGHHTDTVNSVAFSPDGQLLVSGSDDYTFKVWDVSRQREIESLQHITDNAMSQIKMVTFSPNGQRLATAGDHVKLWSTHNWTERTTLRHDAWVWAVAFSADGKLLATGDASGRVNVWDVQKRRIVTQLQGDTEHIGTVAFSPDNRILAAAGYEGKVKLWKVANWEYLGTLNANGTVHEVSFSPDSRTLVSTGYESVNLWKVESGAKIATLAEHTGWVNATAFSPDGGTLISGGEDETLRIWDATPYRSTPQTDMVRIVYFLPRDRQLQPDMWTKLDNLIRDVQSFYADQMEINGFGRKTFTFETDEDGEMLVYRFDGQFNDKHYHTGTQEKVYTEISDQFDMAKHAYLIVVDISSEAINEADTCGVGGGHWFEGEMATRARGGYAVVPASGRCFNAEAGKSVTAHELGHAFGLEHDFRDDTYIMSYGAAPDRLSPCAAGWLNASRFFNTDQTAFNTPTTLQMLTPSSYLPNAPYLTLRFQVTDVDEIRQVQLLVPTTKADPASGVKLHSCRDRHTQSGMVEFDAPTLTAEPVNTITVQVIDAYGNITRQASTLKADGTLLVQDPMDVNSDGVVNIQDLVLVAVHFGQTGQNSADVNGDSVVNISDLILVAGVLEGDAAAAPALHASDLEGLTAAVVQARQIARTDSASLRAIAVLEQLLARLRPKETALLTNYPNPFNPETWIPYQLAEPAEVILYIYSVKGALVRTLALGHQPAGMYHSRNRAAYWDGRNEQSEPVANGIYFYTLSAGDFTATRKMLIQK